MTSPRRPFTYALTALALSATALFSTGCETTQAEPEVTMDELIAEARDLRARNAQVESALDESERIRNQLEAERDRLSSDLDTLESRLAEANQRPETGFDNIAGAEVSFRSGQIVVQVAGDVLFGSGQATLKSGSKSTLDEIARTILRSYPDNEVRIAGHTDTDPIRKSGWKTNERLAAERALAVEEYLASRGLDKDRMHIASYGPARPKGSKKDSRRVEIIIIADER